MYSKPHLNSLIEEMKERQRRISFNKLEILNIHDFKSFESLRTRIFKNFTELDLSIESGINTLLIFIDYCHKLEIANANLEDANNELLRTQNEFNSKNFDQNFLDKKKLPKGITFNSSNNSSLNNIMIAPKSSDTRDLKTFEVNKEESFDKSRKEIIEGLKLNYDYFNRHNININNKQNKDGNNKENDLIQSWSGIANLFPNSASVKNENEKNKQIKNTNGIIKPIIIANSTNKDTKTSKAISSENKANSIKLLEDSSSKRKEEIEMMNKDLSSRERESNEKGKRHYNFDKIVSRNENDEEEENINENTDNYRNNNEKNSEYEQQNNLSQIQKERSTLVSDLIIEITKNEKLMNLLTKNDPHLIEKLVDPTVDIQYVKMVNEKINEYYSKSKSFDCGKEDNSQLLHHRNTTDVNTSCSYNTIGHKYNQYFNTNPSNIDQKLNQSAYSQKNTIPLYYTTNYRNYELNRQRRRLNRSDSTGYPCRFSNLVRKQPEYFDKSIQYGGPSNITGEYYNSKSRSRSKGSIN